MNYKEPYIILLFHYMLLLIYVILLVSTNSLFIKMMDIWLKIHPDNLNSQNGNYSMQQHKIYRYLYTELFKINVENIWHFL